MKSSTYRVYDRDVGDDEMFEPDDFLLSDRFTQSSTDRESKRKPITLDASWLVVVAVAFNVLQAVSLGQTLSLGVLIPDLETKYPNSTQTLSVIPSLTYGMFLLAGFLVPLALKHVSFHTWFIAMVLGMLCWVIAYLIPLFVSEVVALTIMYGLLGGTGAGILYWLPLHATRYIVQGQEDNVLPMIMLGTSLAPTLYGLITTSVSGQLLKDHVGDMIHANGFIFGLGGICILAALAFIAMAYEPLVELFPKDSVSSSKRQSKQEVLGWTFWLFLVAAFFFQFGFLVPYAHLPTYSVHMNATSIPALSYPTAIHLGSLGGRILAYVTFGCGIFRVLGKWMSLVFVLVGMTVTMFCWILVKDQPSLYAFSVLYGMFSGAAFYFFIAIMASTWRTHTYWLSGAMIPGGALASFFAALIKQNTGSYDGAIWFASAFTTAATVVAAAATYAVYSDSTQSSKRS